MKSARFADIAAGKMLRLRRLELGWSQAQLGEMMDRIALQQVSRYEMGSDRLCVSKLWEAAHALQVPITYFFKGLKPPSADTMADAKLCAILEAAILVPEVAAIPRLDPAHQKAVGALISALTPR